MTFATGTTALQSVDLTTLASVKELIENSVDTTVQDVLIGRMITEVSAEMTRYLGFHTLVSTRTDQYHVPHNRNMLTLDARPVTAITSIKYGRTQATVAAADVVDADDYILHNAAGWLELLTPLIYPNGVFEVSYSGGLGLTGGAVLSAYPDIAGACSRQVKYYMSRSNSMAGSVSTIPGAASSNTREYGLMFSVMNVLDSYRRAVM